MFENLILTLPSLPKNFRVLKLDPSLKSPYPNFVFNFGFKEINYFWFNHLVEEKDSFVDCEDLEVIVEVLAVSVCNTDIQEILKRGARSKNSKRRRGNIYLGHEVVGKVKYLGGKVKNLEIGDHVCVGDFDSCRSFGIEPECDFCNEGKGILCVQKEKRVFKKDSFGAYSDFFKRSVFQLIKIDSSIDLKSATLIEPASIANYSIRKTEVNANKTILILGCGLIGIILVRLLRLYFGTKIKILCFTKTKKHLEVSKDSGADYVFSDFSNIENSNEKLISNQIIESTGFDIIYDFIGNDISINKGINFLKPGGVFYELAFPESKVPVSISEIVRKEISFFGIHGYQGSDDLYTKNDFKIISVARFTDQKDHFCLIKAINLLKEKYKNIKVLLIGSGEKKRDIKNMIDQLKLNKYFKVLDFKKNPYPYIKKSDVFILSTKFEGLPNVILEAMTLNKLVISSNCPTGPSEILDNGNGGLLFKVMNFKQLSQKIIFAIRNKKKCSKKILFAKKRLKRFDFSKNLLKYYSTINNI